MKDSTVNLYNTLKEINLNTNFAELINNNPTLTYNETTLSEAYEIYKRISDLLIQTIDNQIFDTISFTKRSQISASVTAIKQQIIRIERLGLSLATTSALSSANGIIEQILILGDLVETSILLANLIGLADYKHEVLELSQTRQKYQNLLEEISSINNLIADIARFHKVSNALKSNIESLKTEADNKVILIGDASVEVEKLWKLINETKVKIKNDEQDVENKKLGINSFHENIDEYKKSIEELKQNAIYLFDKKTEVNQILSEAQKALKLNSAIGISAAFSSQYESAKKEANVSFWKFSINLWILGAIVFLSAAIGITIWIATGDLSNDHNGISLIIARIVAVTISLTGATFCAKQYIKQKNIAEDYAYKAVLSKSIVAFTDEIKKQDQAKVADYLTRVLEEIHKDPLRQREKNESSPSGLDPNSIINNLIEKISVDNK